MDACERYLATHLDVDNAAFSLTLAEQHSAPLLRHRSLNFVAVNAAAVMRTEGWAHLVAARPALVQDILVAASAAIPAGALPLTAAAKPVPAAAASSPPA